MSLRAIAFDFFGTLARVEDPLFRRTAHALGISPRVWLAAVRHVGLERSFPSSRALVDTSFDLGGHSAFPTPLPTPTSVPATPLYACRDTAGAWCSSISNIAS